MEMDAVVGRGESEEAVRGGVRPSCGGRRFGRRERGDRKLFLVVVDWRRATLKQLKERAIGFAK